MHRESHINRGDPTCRQVYFARCGSRTHDPWVYDTTATNRVIQRITITQRTTEDRTKIPPRGACHGYTDRPASTQLNLTLQGRHSDGDGVSNHQPCDCLLNRLFGRRSKKTSKLRVTGLCAGDSPVTVEFPTQRDGNAENVFIWWRHHDKNEACEYVQPRIPQRTSSDVYMSAPWSLIFRCPSGTTARVLERKVQQDVSINSLALGRRGNKSKSIIFKFITLISGLGIGCECHRTSLMRSQHWVRQGLGAVKQ